MAAKPGNLASALDDVTPPPAVVSRSTEQAAPSPKPAPIPSREGTALVGAHLPTAYGKAMRRLAVDTEKSQRDLFEEALQMLFVRYGVKV